MPKVPSLSSSTTTCPVEGCDRTLDLNAKPGWPMRAVGVCTCERFPGRAVVETDAVGYVPPVESSVELSESLGSSEE